MPVADLILRAATLVDGTGADPVRNVDVVVRDGRIVSVGPTEPAVNDTCVIDYGDATIMPGLIDCHCHLQFGAYAAHEQTRQVHAGASNEERILTAVANAQKALATGVTTLRDTGGFLTLNMSVRDAFVNGRVSGPRLLVCGAPITTTAGHLNWCGLRADSEDEVVRAVRAMVEAGADAHRLDRHVAAHVLGADGCRDAIDAGVDTLEHCSWLTPEGVRGQSAMDMNAVDRIDPSHQSVHMTLAAMNRTPFRGLDHLDALASDERERIRQHGANFREMRERGVPHVISSDAGVIDTPFDEFPLSVVSTVIALDTTPVDAIHLVTSAAAQAIGLGELTGAVAPGRQADLLVVEGDASENICNITRTASVYLGGREVVRNRHLHVNAVTP